MNSHSTDGGNELSEAPNEVRSNPPSMRVAYRLAEETGKGIEELRPLADAIDPEALDAIFDGRKTPDAYVTFRHEGHSITVTGDASVLVDPTDAE